MVLEKKLQQLCENDSEIEIVKLNIRTMKVDVLVPYDTSVISIEIEGNNESEIIESFKNNLNWHLNQMIDHLHDCKL